MLTRARAAAALLLAALLALSPLPAQADTGVTCTGAASLLSGCSSATVTVVVTIGGQQVEVSLSGGSATVVCHTTWGVPSGGAPAVIPCDSSAGWWSGTHQCYVREMSPQPPASDALWQGRVDGKVYDCTLPPGVAGPNMPFWAQDPPVSSAQVVNLAAKAVQSLGLTAIDIGMAPTPTSIDPASIGVVGLPNWMWVKNPSPRTYGPAVGSATDGVVTVTVTAKVGRVTWTLGDGSAPIICTTAGTPYAASYGATSSPDCGRNPGYQRPGTYSVEAASHWTITYTSSVGVGGTLSMSLTGTSSLTVGEFQSLAG